MPLIFSRDQVFTVCEVLDAIEEGEEFDNVAGIAIEPPEVRAETDEDSGDEDLDPGSANRLTGFQLRARAHLLRRNRDSDSDNSDDEAQTQTAQVQTQSSTSKRRKKSAAYLFHRVYQTAHQDYYQFFLLLIIRHTVI